MKSYRKKPVVIQAGQWDGSLDSTLIFEREYGVETLGKTFKGQDVSCWKIGTLEGGHTVSKGDYIICGVAGEFYPCKPDIFKATYEDA